MDAPHPAGPATARALNDRHALDLLLERGPLTAGQLASLTGLSRPTVAELVERLRRARLVEVVGEASVPRRGPNARLYGLAADRAHVAGAEVHPDGMSVAVADLAGRVVSRAELPLGRDADPGTAVPAALAALDDAVARVSRAPAHTVAVGAPGMVDPATGLLNPTGGRPGWHAELVRRLRERGGRVLVENEVNLAGIAEGRLGAARDTPTFVLLWLGAGVGAATLLDGRLRRGASGGSGELGFLPVPGTRRRPSAEACTGGLHSLVSGAAVAALAREHG
ncbi:MAG: ROK family transcriptional regulator, partial [Dactylosporangium sp.]|nr:ROK family transcriptional regulator [Dactylosporangium sp.]NNJ63339.1 ROK family transcriptional regulator [Dactylosporangium sp.]